MTDEKKTFHTWARFEPVTWKFAGNPMLGLVSHSGLGGMISGNVVFIKRHKSVSCGQV